MASPTIQTHTDCVVTTSSGTHPHPVAGGYVGTFGSLALREENRGSTGPTRTAGLTFLAALKAGGAIDRGTWHSTACSDTWIDNHFRTNGRSFELYGLVGGYGGASTLAPVGQQGFSLSNAAQSTAKYGGLVGLGGRWQLMSHLRLGADAFVTSPFKSIVAENAITGTPSEPPSPAEITLQGVVGGKLFGLAAGLKLDPWNLDSLALTIGFFANY